MARKTGYDEIADWYPAWVGDGDGLIADGVGDLVPSTVRGSRVLDVACGHGRASRGLARLGSDVVGVDISAELIALGRSRGVTAVSGSTTTQLMSPNSTNGGTVRSSTARYTRWR